MCRLTHSTVISIKAGKRTYTLGCCVSARPFRDLCGGETGTTATRVGGSHNFRPSMGLIIRGEDSYIPIGRKRGRERSQTSLDTSACMNLEEREGMRDERGLPPKREGDMLSRDARSRESTGSKRTKGRPRDPLGNDGISLSKERENEGGHLEKLPLRGERNLAT